jgi:hypothetical protein
MPMNTAQLAALVDKARQKPPPVSVTPSAPTQLTRTMQPARTNAAIPSPPQPEHTAETAEPDDFPIGWELKKDSWHFHRRFYAIFKRPMHCGEYSHLLWQIRRRRAEHLWNDCWRITLPDGRRTLAVRGTRWSLITILPQNWQPPVPAE